MRRNRGDASIRRGIRRALALPAVAALAGAAVAAVETGGELRTISGTLPSVITADRGPYLVTSDIVVPLGRTVRIDSGVVLLFTEFTELHVYGTLLAHGAAADPIVFTSANDTVCPYGPCREPAPYDWNGITVYESGGGSRISHAGVSYSLYGINALTEQIVLEEVTFRRIGTSGLTVLAREVEADSVVNWRGPPVRRLRAAYRLAGKKGNARSAPRRIALRIGGAAVVAAGVAAALWHGRRWHDAAGELDALGDTGNPANLKNPRIEEEWNDAHRLRNTHAAWTVAAAVTAGVGGLIFVLSFGP